MEGECIDHMSGSSFVTMSRVAGTSPMIPIFLSLSFFARNVRQEYYGYGIIAAGALLGMSLYIGNRIRSRSEGEVKSMGDLSRSVCAPLGRVVDVFVVASRYMTLLIILDVFANILFVYFPLLDEVRQSLAVYRVLFSMGLALAALTLYMSSNNCQRMLPAVSLTATLVFVCAVIAEHFLGADSALPMPRYTVESPLPSLFWATTLAFYTMDFVSGSVQTASSMNRYASAACASVVSAIYLTMVFCGAWMRSNPDSLSIVKQIFLDTSSLNQYLKTSTIDRYFVTSRAMRVSLPILCVALFLMQFDVLMESLRNMVDVETNSRMWIVSFVLLAAACMQTLFNELTGELHFYLMVAVLGATPLVASYPFVCNILASKKVTPFLAICILALLFMCAAAVGTARILTGIV